MEDYDPYDEDRLLYPNQLWGLLILIGGLVTLSLAVLALILVLG